MNMQSFAFSSDVTLGRLLSQGPVNFIIAPTLFSRQAVLMLIRFDYERSYYSMSYFRCNKEMLINIHSNPGCSAKMLFLKLLLFPVIFTSSQRKHSSYFSL